MKRKMTHSLITKIGVAFFALIGTISMVYTMNKDLSAAPSTSAEYYGFNEPIHLTNSNTFTMGGLKWWIFYADQNSGSGYIIADNVVKQYCSNISSGFGNNTIAYNQVDPCIGAVQGNYSGGSDDDVGAWIKKINSSSVSALKLPSLNEYNEFTEGEANLSSFVTPNAGGCMNYIWLADSIDSGRIVFPSGTTPPSASLISGYTYLQKVTSTSTVAKINPVFKISLPQKNQITKGTFTATSTSFKYDDADIQPGTVFGTLGVEKGEGPYTFSIESGTSTSTDIDVTGAAVPVGKTFTTDVEAVNVDNANGTADIQVKSGGTKLPVGTHYIKVKIKDTSSNIRLYTDENDTYRTKTLIFKLTITKSDQNAIKVYDDSAKTNEVTEISKDQSSTEFYIYPDGGATDILNSTFKYEIESGSNIISSLDATGAQSKIKLSGVAGEAVIKITKPGGSNYNDITTKVKIKVGASMSMTYTPDYQGHASSIYEYDENVYGGDVIGAIAYKDGTAPYTFELTQDSNFPSDTDSYKDFEIGDLDANNQTISSSPNPLKVSIKSNAKNLETTTNSLKAGDYHFCIVAYDANGDPVNPDGSKKLKSCQTITVEKTQPEISFDSDDQGTIYVTGSTTSTTSHNEHASYTNGEDGNTDIKIVYSIKNATAGLLTSGLPFTSTNAGDQPELIFTAGVSGAITIEAKLPATDNYKEAVTTKTINVQLGMNGSYFEDKTNIKAGSEAAKPPSTYSPSYKIGHLVISGGTAPYTYSLPSGEGDNGSFHIDNDGYIYVNSSVGSNGLTPKEYTIKASVSDSTTPTLQTAKIEGKITIGNAEPNGISFAKPNDLTAAISGNTIEATYDPSANGGAINTKLLETTPGALSGTTITYAVDPDPNTIVEITNSSGSGAGNSVSMKVKKASADSELNTVKLIATIKNGIYGSEGITKEVLINVKKYTQTIAFQDTSKLKLPVGSACVNVNATITSTYSIPNGKIEYTSSDHSANAPFTINSDGKVCPTSNAADAGSAILKGKLVGNDNYTDAMTGIGRTIEVYVPGGIDVTGSIQDAGTTNVTYTAGTLMAVHDSPTNKNGQAKINEQVAKVFDTVSTSPTYTMSNNIGVANADSALFTVTPTGFVLLNQDVYASDIISHSTGNIYYIQVDVTDDHAFTTTVDVQIVFEKAKADFYFIDPITATKVPIDHVYSDGKTNVPMYEETYAKNGSIEVKTNLNATYSEDTSGDQDVIDLKNRGTFDIINASDTNAIYGGMGGNTYVKACMNETDGYASQCIYAQVIIKQAEQSDFAFVNSPTWTLGKTSTTIMPTYNNKLSAGDVVLSSSDQSIIEIQAPVSGSDQSFKIIGTLGSVTLTGTAPEDRNYKSKQATTTVVISDKPPTTLSLFVSAMTYGDTDKKVQITNGYKTGIPTYFYTSDASILKVDSTAVNGKESSSFTALQSGQVTVSVCQTSDPFDPLTDDCNAIGGDYGQETIFIKQKPITFTYENEAIFTGEQEPQYRLKEVSASQFAFTDHMSDFTMPKNTGTGLKDTNTAGAYDIIGSYANEELIGVMGNYKITLEKGTLTIKQDEAKTSWIELKGKTSGKLLDAKQWHNEDVEIIVKDAKGSAGKYTQMSDDGASWNTTITVNKEDENKKSLSFRIMPNHIISSTIDTTVKIDKTPPVITSMTGETVNEDTSSKVLNFLTFGRYFKPGIEVKIEAKDTEKGTRKISGLKELTYTVYEVDETGKVDLENPYDTDTISASASTRLPVLPKGKFEVCATVKDQAGNESSETCRKLWIRDIGDDTNGDGIPDVNIDIDGDGIPDLNITKNPDDKLPYLNIDTTGNGEADMNIDIDGDGIPDLNTGIVDTWVTDLNVDLDKDGEPDYKTSSTLKGINNIDTNDNQIPDINIDLNLDGIPELNINTDGELKLPQVNIDGNGDGEADINIDVSGNGKPEQNVMSITEWKPDMNYVKDGKVLYETMQMKYKPIEELEDNGIVVRPSDNNISFLPNMALKVIEKTESVSEDELAGILKESGLTNGEVKSVYDVKLMENNAVIQPNGNVIVKIPVDTTIKNPKLMMKAKDGTWKAVQAKEEGGYYVFETDYIGDVSILGETQETPVEPEPKPVPTPAPSDDTEPSTTEPTTQKGTNNPAPTVQGTYTGQATYPGNNVGGAMTGDHTNIFFYIGLISMTLGMFCFIWYKKETKKRR